MIVRIDLENKEQKTHVVSPESYIISHRELSVSLHSYVLMKMCHYHSTEATVSSKLAASVKHAAGNYYAANNNQAFILL